MSDERYEITASEDGISITSPDGIVDQLIASDPEDGTHLDDIVIGAIRQQSADIAALKDALADEVTANEAFRKAGGARDDEDMPAFCARLIAEAEIGRKWNANSALEEWFPLTADRLGQDAQEIAKLRTDLAAAVAARANMDADRLEWMNRAEQAEARLAAIDAAPTVGWLRPYGRGLSTSEPSGERMPQYELITRPAKD